MGIMGSFQGMVDSPYYLMKEGASGTSKPSVISEMYSTPFCVTQTSSGYNEDDWSRSAWYLWYKVGNSSNGASRLHVFNKAAISFAAYTKLFIKVTSTAYGNPPTYQRFGVNSSGAVTGNNFQSYIDIATSISNGVYELNINSLNSTYYIYLWQQLPATGSRGASGSVLSFYEIYLIA